MVIETNYFCAKCGAKVKEAQNNCKKCKAYLAPDGAVLTKKIDYSIEEFQNREWNRGKKERIRKLIFRIFYTLIIVTMATKRFDIAMGLGLMLGLYAYYRKKEKSNYKKK